MISGIGTDAVEVGRIAAALERHGQRFAERILGEQELVLYARRSARSTERGLLFLATRFAAKEAISKALGLGMRHPMSWRAAQILNAPSGRPEVRVDGALAEFVSREALRLHITVSDLREMAFATAVAERVTTAEAGAGRAG
jgi:holo-[acyl-carrier protein] synthase